jgi:glycosidase
MKKFVILLVSIFILQACGTGISSTFPEESYKAPKAGQYAPRKVKGGVEFTYSTKTTKKKVCVVGTFNKWNKESHPMKEVEKGIWKIVMPVSTGRHEYKFLINGGMWVADRQNPAKTPDGWGNSIISVSEQKVEFPTQGVSAKNPGHLYSSTQAYDSPEWVRDAVIYELFPRVFTKKGYKGLITKLDYLQDLGIDTIWIMPTFPIGKIKRKGTLGSPYSVKSFHKINPEFGTAKDFKEFVDQAHKRNMKVILDWVPNHSAWDNKLLKTHPEYYMKDKKGKIIVPLDTDWTDVAQFEYGNAGMQDYMIEELKYWVTEYKIDGYRMDVAGRIPHEFWDRLRVELNKINPEIMLLAESEEAEHHIHGFDLTYAGGIKGIVKNIATGNSAQYDFYKTYNAMRYNFPKGALRMHWMENHDQEHALKNMGKKAIYPAAVIHLTLDGVPMIHQGQEFGDTKWQDWHSLFDAMQLEWDKFDQTLFNHYQSLIKIRKSSPALSRGELILIENDQKKVVSYARVLGKEKFLVVVNLSSKSKEVRFNKRDLKKAGIKISSFEKVYRLKKGSSIVDKEWDGNVSLEARESMIIKIK